MQTQKNMPNSTVEFWSSLLSSLTVITGVVAAALAAVALWFSRQESKHKAEQFAAFKEESNVRVSEAEAKAANANMTAAIANERAAKLEVKSLSAQVEIQKLLNLQRDRTIGFEESKQFIKAMKSVDKSNPIVVLTPPISGGDAYREASFFAGSIFHLLKSAGFEVTREDDMNDWNFGPGVPNFRIFLPFEGVDESVSKLVEELSNAFTAMGHAPRILTLSNRTFTKVTIVVGRQPTRLDPSTR